jgi:Ca2+-binding EF-hand superfamily protein
MSVQEFSGSFQRVKLIRAWNIMDINRDGKCTQDDFIEWGRRVASASEIEFTSDLEEAYISVWGLYFGDGKGDDMEEWIEFMSSIADSPGVIEIGAKNALIMFDAIDTDHDDFISPLEYKSFVRPLGVTSDNAISAFQMIDADEDGFLSREEFALACSHYYFDKEPSKYQNFFGPFSFSTPFQRAKLERVWNIMDINRDGKCTQDDFIEWGRRVASASEIEFTSDLEDAYISVWRSYFGDGKGNNMEEWIEFMSSIASMPDAIEIGAKIAWKMFDAIDIDHGGSISHNQFHHFIHALGISESDSEKAFKIIDADEDGFLSRKEFALACSHYYFDKEPSKYQNLYGPFSMRQSKGVTFKEFDSFRNIEKRNAQDNGEKSMDLSNVVTPSRSCFCCK